MKIRPYNNLTLKKLRKRIKTMSSEQKLKLQKGLERRLKSINRVIAFNINYANGHNPFTKLQEDKERIMDMLILLKSNGKQKIYKVL